MTESIFLIIYVSGVVICAETLYQVKGDNSQGVAIYLSCFFSWATILIAIFWMIWKSDLGEEAEREFNFFLRRFHNINKKNRKN